MKMVRKQVYLEPEQDERLKQLSKHLGVTEAELIRHGVDFVTQGAGELDRGGAWKELLALIETRARQFSEGGSTVKFNREELYAEPSPHLDAQAWEEELAFIKERARLMPEGGSTDRWRREDSYDERRPGLSR
jgi:hypothetical protein